MNTSVAFAFKAVRQDGAIETGTVEAASREAAIAQLGTRGAFAVSVSVAPAIERRPAGLSADDLAQGLRALATLLGSGVPLGRALAILEELAPPSWRHALPALRQRVEQGESLGAGLEASSLGLPPYVLGLLQAGEAGSGLTAALESAAQMLETRVATQTAVRNALAYPLMLAVAGGASVALLVGVVLPRFANLLADAGQTLPLSTRLVLQLGSTARAVFVPGMLLLIGLTVLWRAWVATPEGMKRWHHWLLTGPVIGTIRWSAASANACSALTALLSAGVPLAVALPHAGRASGDRALESRLLAARRRIESGQSIASAMHAEAALTPAAIRLVRVGEETGALAGMLGHAARIESEQALQRLRRLIRILEPMLILLFGCLVMAVAAALLQAMYGLRPSL